MILNLPQSPPPALPLVPARCAAETTQLNDKEQAESAIAKIT
jgi:hypothetical protein